MDEEGAGLLAEMLVQHPKDAVEVVGSTFHPYFSLNSSTISSDQVKEQEKGYSSRQER